MSCLKVGVVGIGGFAGAELVSLIACHPYLALSVGFSSRPDYHSPISGCAIYPLSAVVEQVSQLDVLLLATPPDVSIEIVASLNELELLVIDLSGGFRLSELETSKHYALKRSLAGYESGAHYGLLPWSKPEKFSGGLIANPGCYATAALMSLMPLLKHQLIKPACIIDAKSGVSGAGKNPQPHLMYSEVAENLFPYKIGQHQHVPEIESVLEKECGVKIEITMTTQIIPVKRGIAMCLYADSSDKDVTDTHLLEKISVAYGAAYSDYPLVEYWNIQNGSDPSVFCMKKVVGTAGMLLGYSVKNKKIIIHAFIDNLMKGAASQAIENINQLNHWPVDLGLTKHGGVLCI